MLRLPFGGWVKWEATCRRLWTYLFPGDGGPDADDVSDHTPCIPSNSPKDIEQNCQPVLSLISEKCDIP